MTASWPLVTTSLTSTTGHEFSQLARQRSVLQSFFQVSGLLSQVCEDLANNSYAGCHITWHIGDLQHRANDGPDRDISG